MVINQFLNHFLGAAVLFFLLAFSSTFVLAESEAGPNVKKSNARVCYEKGTRQYDSIKIFSGFDSMQACQASGGRQTADSVLATPTPASGGGDSKNGRAVSQRPPQQL